MQSPIKSYYDVLTFGKYKGKTVEAVPSSYIVWLVENDVCEVVDHIYDAARLDVVEDYAYCEAMADMIDESD